MRSLCLSVCLLLCSAPLLADDLFLRGGQLVDPESRTVRQSGLLIVDGRIAGFPDAPPEGFTGEMIDATGRWIVPGLRDLHVHSTLDQAPGGVRDLVGTEAVARRVLHAGVVGFLDLFNGEDFVFGARNRQRARLERGAAKAESAPPEAQADIFAAGPCLTATKGHCTEYGVPTRVIDSPEDARREITELAAKKPDVVKLVYSHLDEALKGKTWRPPRPSIDQPTLQAAVDTARQHGLPTVVHIRSWRDIEHAVEAGATAVTHLPSYGAVPEGLAERMAEAGTVVIPTLAVGDVGLATEPGLVDHPLLAAVASPRILDAYRRFDVTAQKNQGFLKGMAGAQQTRMQALAELAAAGVPIVAGTDAGNQWTVQGFSLHRELELYVQAGLTPWQALASATTEAGRFLGRSWSFNQGDEASLVILRASPLDDIRNTREIAEVILRGHRIQRESAEPKRLGKPIT